MEGENIANTNTLYASILTLYYIVCPPVKHDSET